VSLLKNFVLEQREILYLIVIMKPKIFFIQWVWSLKIYTHVLRIVYYTGKIFELLKNCLRCGLSRYKLKQKDDDTIEEIQRDVPPMKGVWYLPNIPRMKR